MKTDERKNITPTLGRALDGLGVPYEWMMGAISLSGGRLWVRAWQVKVNHCILFESFIAVEDEHIRTSLPSRLPFHPDEAEESVWDACLEWGRCCLAPLLNALAPRVEPTTNFYLFVAQNAQQLFDVYAGDYLVFGENHEQWSNRFRHSLVDWVIARSRLRVPARRFNLLRFGCRTRDGIDSVGLCELNGQPWPEADAAMQQLEWPGTGEQRLINYVVLRRIPQVVGAF